MWHIDTLISHKQCEFKSFWKCLWMAEHHRALWRVSWPLDKVHALHSTLTETQNTLSPRRIFKIPDDWPGTISENHSLTVYLVPQPLSYEAPSWPHEYCCLASEICHFLYRERWCWHRKGCLYSWSVNILTESLIMLTTLG